MKKRIISGLLTSLLLVWCFCMPVLAEESFNNEVKNSVLPVGIQFEYSDGRLEFFGHGTGFFVGEKGENPEYIITNHHVIETYADLGKGELFYATAENGEQYPLGRAKIFAYFSETQYMEAFLVVANETTDLAILRLESPTTLKKPMVLVDEVTDKNIGDTVFAVGYPGIADSIYTDATQKMGEEDASVTRGVIGRLLTTSGSGQRLIQTDADIAGGNSGGPLVNSKGYLVGINVSKVSNSASMEDVNYAVDVAELIYLLKQNGIPYETVKSSGSGSAMVIIGVVAVAIIAGVSVIVLKKSKKTVKQTKALVRSMATQHNGLAITLYPDQAICIGRDFGSCKLVFSDDTPGVSSRHCSLEWNAAENMFTLIDLNSTYGTYLANGQKLVSGVPHYLKVGDCFFLGERANILRLEVE